MAFIRQVSESEATGALDQIYAEARERAGSVVNIIKLMSLDVTVLQQYIEYYVALMKSPNALDGARRELIAAVVSNVNDCYY